MRRALIAITALAALIAGCGGVEQEPNLADVRGEPTVHYRLVVDSEKAELLGGPGDTTEIDVWIDGEGIIRRIRAEEIPGLTGTIEFFDFGVEVDIEPPPDDQVVEIDAPCEPGEARPIWESQAVKALRSHRLSVIEDEQACFGDVAAVLTNAPPGDAADVLGRASSTASSI